MNRTIKNLAAAFVGESQARNRYTMYAKIAKKEGYEQISDIFIETADQEKEHAKNLFVLISGLKGEETTQLDEITIETSISTIYGNTEENLAAAISGEHHEFESMYPEFAQIANEEGFEKIATKLRAIALAEAHHEERFQKLLTELKNKTIFKKEAPVTWICQECGYADKGVSPPEVCPSCDHPKAYFRLQCEKY